MLRTLLNFWLMPFFGMMFAASAGVLDGAASETGGGDGAASPVGDGGDVSQDGDGSGADDIGDGEGFQQEGDDLRQDGDASGESDQDSTRNQGANSLDTKGFNPEDKKLLSLAQKAGPKEAQRVRQLLFAEKKLLKVIPTGVKGVVDLVRAVEDFGGVEGVQNLQADLQSHQQSDESFDRADPKWVESGFEKNPESSLKLFAHTLDYVSEKHPEHYNHLMGRVILNDLKEYSPVGAIYTLLSGMKDNPEALKLATELNAYYKERRDLASKIPEKKIEPREQALTAREKATEEKEMNLRYTEVNRDVLPQMRAGVAKTLREETKRDGLDIDKLSKEYPAEWQSMLSAIHKGIKAAAFKDQRFIDKHFALIKKGEIKRAAAAVNAKHAEIIPDIVRQVRQTFGVFRKKAAGPGNRNANADKGNTGTQNNANTGWNRVSARPQNSLIDWAKTTQSMQLDGKYILKDGKKVVVQY